MQNLKKIICVAGLPASGKSSWAIEYASNHNNTFIIDDEILMNNTSEYFYAMANQLKSYELIIVVDVHFCETSVRQKAQVLLEKTLDIVPDWIFFENNPDAALINAQGRPNKPVNNLIKHYSKIYHPSGTIIPVYEKLKQQKTTIGM